MFASMERKSSLGKDPTARYGACVRCQRIRPQLAMRVYVDGLQPLQNFRVVG